MKNFPLSYRVKKHNTYEFPPSGNPAEDTPKWEKLVDAVNAYTPAGKYSDVIIRDNANSMVVAAGNTTRPVGPTSEFLKGAWVKGETKNSRIQFNDGYLINWGRYGNPINPADTYPWFARGTMSAMTAFSSRVMGSTVTLAKGDYVVVWSTDAVSGVPAHTAGGTQRSAQLLRVNHQDGGGWILDGDVIDPLTTTPSICKVEMLRGCGISDLTIGSNSVENNDIVNATAVPAKGCFNVQRCHGFVMTNVQADDTGCGDVTLHLCADSSIEGYNGTWQFNNRRNYAVVFGLSHNCVFRDSTWHNTRHMITSAGLAHPGSSTIRYGASTGGKAINLHQWVSGDQLDTAFSGMDLHAETYGFEFQDCHIHNSMYWAFPGEAGTEEFYGFSTRSRNTRFINCYVHSAMHQASAAAESYYGQPATGFRIMGNDAYLKGCFQDRGWRGVLIQADLTDTAFHPQRTKIEGCTFENIAGPIVYMTNITSNGVEMLYNTARNCGAYYVPAGSPEFNSAIIRIRNGSSHKIRFNNLDKAASNYALDCNALTESNIDFKGNSCKGYGSGKIGIRGDSGDPKGVSIGSAATFNTAVAAKNYTD